MGEFPVSHSPAYARLFTWRRDDVRSSNQDGADVGDR